ncbi:Uncharacterised protein [BD1-7 clade bacterium]|uniref:PBP domain-containing protein n=1 Tax=BD1-7 clade bacterium TaxID=2029982 RepID=A0A5S9MXG6_9GAMM|nr:Uncharacterised protein [BD1-7 clade bacterium]CAA0083484.1 Uncharacterised protein [BD1-7 clade bacterium]
MQWIKVISLSLIVGLSMIPSAYANVVVVTHPDNKNMVDLVEIRRMFLGKTKTWDDGSKVQPADLDAGQPGRDTFLKQVVRKSESSLNSYWARMLFSSKGKPPRQFVSPMAMQEWLIKTPGAIGYVDQADLNPSVKVLLVLE